MVSTLRPPDNERKCSRIRPWVSMQASQETETETASTTADWLPTKLHSRAAARCESNRRGFSCGSWLCFTVFSSWGSGILKQRLTKLWIGRGGPTTWTAPSADCNPLHFCLWRHQNSAVYAAEVSDVPFLQQRTQNGFDTIRMRRGILQRVRQITVQTCNVLCGSSRRALWAFYLIFRRP